MIEVTKENKDVVGSFVNNPTYAAIKTYLAGQKDVAIRTAIEASSEGESQVAHLIGQADVIQKLLDGFTTLEHSIKGTDPKSTEAMGEVFDPEE